MSPLRPAPFLVQKALKTANSEKPVFRVRRQVSLKFRSFSVESRLQTLTLLRIPLSARKTSEFHPAELVTVCHRFVTALFWAKKCAKAAKFPIFVGNGSIMEPGDSWLGRGAETAL